MLAKITLPEPQRNHQHQEKVEHLELITSGVAHDFNNLLTSILGQSSLALKQLPPEDRARRHIEKAIKAAEYAALLTRQLLTFARNGLSESQAINLNQIVSDNAGLLKTVFMDNITLQLDLCRHMPLIIAAPGQIQQVVMNLIINAAESIQSRAGTVTVRTGKQRRPRNGNGHFNGHQVTEEYVYFQVSDTGCGIDETTLKRIFDPFFTTKPSGKGVGLSAVRDIVNAYQGDITVDSNPGQGTTITVYLPCRRDELTPQLTIH